MNILYTHGR